MELEIGVRITRDAGDLTFASTETETIFILAAHLPGFTKDEIEVAKNEGEDQISIRGGGHIACQEAVITSRVSITREASLECFDESFPVPHGVDWDRIDAWFDEEEKILIISIPKLWTGEEEEEEEEEGIAEHPIQEERQVCKELVQGETQEPTEEEKNEESELHGLTMPHKEKEKIMEQQAPAGILHLPKIPEESMQLSPAEEQLQQEEADDKDKIAALPEYPESKEHLQIMQVEAERFNREDEDEAAREHITPRGKKQTKLDIKMVALGDDFTASDKANDSPTELKKPSAEGAAAETSKIEDYRESETPKKEFHSSKKAAGEHKIPFIDKPPETKKTHETPEQRPVQKPEKKLHEEHKIPTTMKPMDKEQEAMVLAQQREPWHAIEVQQKYKTPDVTEPETREPSKVKGTAQQFQQQEEEDEQNQKKPLVKGPDQVLGTEQLIELKKEHEDIEIEEPREIKREKPQVKTSDAVLQAELNESEKEEVELQPNEKDEEKLTRGTVYEKPIAAGWPEARKSEIELQGTKEDEVPKLTSLDIEKRASIETKSEFQDVHQKEKKIKQCHEKPTEKPSQLIKEQKSEEKAEKDMHQHEEGSKENKNFMEKLPHVKPKTEKLPEPKEPHQKDGKLQLERTEVMEAKHQTKSQETEEEIQKQEQEREKPAAVQKYRKSEDVGLLDNELKQRLLGLKDDEDRQSKDPDTEAFRARESLKPNEFSLDIHKQKTEKPTLKAPKEMREAAEPIKTEKEEKAELELQKPKEEEAQEQKMPIRLSHEKTRTTKFQVPKESEQKLELARVKAPEQVLEAARDIQSEPEKELKVQEDKEPIVVREMPKTMELPQKKEPKPRVDEFNEDEYHQWMRPDKEASKTRMSLELEEIYKNLQQEEEEMKRKAKKPVEKAQQQLFEVSESTKSGDKEAKKVTAQPKEQEAREQKPIRQLPHEEVSAGKLSEPKKPVQVHEKAGVKEPDKILEQARQIQPEDILEELKHHEDEVQEHDKFVVAPTYEKPEATGLIENEELKPALPVLKDDEEKQWKIPDTRIPKSRESQELHQEQVKKKQKIRQILKAKEPTQLGEEEKEAKQQLEQPGQQEPSECKKPTLHPQHEKHITTQSIEPKETDQDHKPKVTEQVQLLEGEQVQSEELVEDQKQNDQKAQELKKPIIVPTCEKLQGTTPDQVLEDEKHFPPKQLEKEFQQHGENWQQKKEKHTLVSTCEKPKAAEYARKEEPKPQISEFQGDKNHQRIGPDIETFTTKKLLKLEEESELPQKEQEIGQEEKELQEKEAPVHKKPEPGKTRKKEQQRDQLNRKPMNQEETTLLDSEAEKEKIPTGITVGTKGMLQSREPYEKSEKSLHVEAELQLKRPEEIEARKRLCPGVGAQLLDKPAVGPFERESQTKEVQQATEYSIPRIQPPDSKQPKELEGPRSRRYIKEESKEQLEQQFKQPDEEEAQKRESPMRELTHNGAIREPPDQAVHVKAIMEQEVYTSEGGGLEQEIESPKLQKPPPFSSKLEDRKVLERFDTTVKPPKPLPRIRGVMKALLTMEKEATEPSIPSPRISISMEPEGSPLQPSPDEEAIEREFPSLIQKELHPYTDLQKPEEQETASRQMPEFQEAVAEQQGKTNELPAPHKAQEEIEQLAEEVPHKIFEVPQQMKIRELELHTPKELEEEQEENPPSPLGHDMKTLEEVSQDEADASGAEMDKSTKVTNLSRRRRFRCRCQGRRPAFPVPPSTVLSGSAFVFSIMVLVFHFIKRKKSNIK